MLYYWKQSNKVCYSFQGLAFTPFSYGLYVSRSAFFISVSRSLSKDGIRKYFERDYFDKKLTKIKLRSVYNTCYLSHQQHL